MSLSQSLSGNELPWIYQSLVVSVIKECDHKLSDQITLHQTTSETVFITSFSWINNVLSDFLRQHFSLNFLTGTGRAGVLTGEGFFGSHVSFLRILALLQSLCTYPPSFTSIPQSILQVVHKCGHTTTSFWLFIPRNPVPNGMPLGYILGSSCRILVSCNLRVKIGCNNFHRAWLAKTLRKEQYMVACCLVFVFKMLLKYETTKQWWQHNTCRGYFRGWLIWNNEKASHWTACFKNICW